MRTSKRKSRVLPAILAAGLVLSNCPASVYAEEASAGDTSRYVLMNIPYDAFYAAEVKNEVKVDAFTSATKSKTKTSSLSGGSYHTEDGEEITGVTFPVKLEQDVDLSSYTRVTDSDELTLTVTNRGQTTTTTYYGKDVLFEQPTYSYYELSEAPAYYKELTVGEDGTFSFGEAAGTRQNVSGIKASLTTETTYGDYQLDIDEAVLTEAELDLAADQIYGVVISTKEEHDYGLRHLENIWRGTDLAWCSGFTEAVHNCPTSSKHYKTMMGETITDVTYYTSKGIFDFSLAEEVYVPVKFAYTLEVADASVTAGKTSVAAGGFPQDYQADYKIEGLESAVVENGEIRFHLPKQGSYTLVVSDKGQKYADVKADFILYTENIPAAYNNNSENPALTAAASANTEELADFIANITSVSVNGKSYAASGRGAVVIVKADGSIDTAAAPFAEGETFEIAVTSMGYQNPLNFTWSKKKADTGNSSDNKPTEGTNNPSDNKPTEDTKNPSDDKSGTENQEAPAKGDVIKKGNISYKVTKAKAEVAYVSAEGASKTVKIPATVKIGTITYKVTSIAAGAFKGNKKITKAVIGKNVTSIGTGAFSGCTKLKSVTIGAGVKKIGKEAFSGDKKLEKITITSTKLSSVGKNAWKGIKKTAVIKVPKNKLSAYRKLFKGKGQSKTVKISA